MVHFISAQKPLFLKEDNGIVWSPDIGILIQWLLITFVFGVDTETQGEMNFENKVIMLQVGDEKDQFVIDTRSISVGALRNIFESSDWLKIFHNAKFDVNFLRVTFGWRTENVYDTFLAECCITNGVQGRQLGLAALTIKYCNGAQLDKSERGRFVGLGSKAYTHSNIIYGARDVEYLMCIRDSQAAVIQEMELGDVVQLECQVVLALADMEYAGIALSAEKWSELAKGAGGRIKELEKKLDVMVDETPKLSKYRKKYIQQGMFGVEDRTVNISWSSPLQVQKVFKQMGIADIESSSEKEITKYQNIYPLIKTFIDYKKEQKLASTYGLEFLNYINKKTGRIHTSFWQILETHRISSSRPNLQQIPAISIKDDMGNKHYPYLECFVAPEGYIIAGADFNGQELRVIAQGSQDPVWLDAFNNGRDLHGELASKIFGIPIEEVKSAPEFVFVGGTKVYLRGKSPRDVTKTINFMLAYGGSKYKLSDTLGIDVEEADVIIEMYFSLVPKVKRFLDACAAYGIRNKSIRSYRPYSGLRQFEDFDSTDKKKVGEVERASKNTPIQMTSALMCKLALVKIREKIKEVPYKVELFLQVHDAIFCYVEERFAEEWGQILKETMEESGRLWLKSVPCVSDASIHEYWSK